MNQSVDLGRNTNRFEVFDEDPYFVSSMRKRQILSRINRSLDMQKSQTREEGNQSPFAKIVRDQEDLQNNLISKFNMPNLKTPTKTIVKEDLPSVRLPPIRPSEVVTKSHQQPFRNVLPAVPQISQNSLNTPKSHSNSPALLKQSSDGQFSPTDFLNESIRNYKTDRFVKKMELDEQVRKDR